MQFGVPQPDRYAVASSPICFPEARRFRAICSLLYRHFSSDAVGVGHPVESLPDVRCPDAVCAQYRSPAGVAFSFQVSTYSIEPPFPNRAFNLFAKHNVRAALRDEIVEHGPEVAGVGGSELLASGTERLAGATAGPDWSIVGPSSKAEGVAPASDSGEEMTLCVFSKFICFDFRNAALIHNPVGDVSAFDEFAQPCGRLGVELVVVVHSPFIASRICQLLGSTAWMPRGSGSLQLFEA